MKRIVEVFSLIFLLMCGILSAAELPASIESFDTKRVPVTYPTIPDELGRMPSTERLKALCKDCMALSEEEIIPLLPEKGGIHFSNCPVPGCGNRGEKFTWDIRKPEVLVCSSCKTELKVADFPETEKVEAATPEGVRVTYTYYKRADGRYCWITSGMDFRKYQYFMEKAWYLGALYGRTGDRQFARRAAVIIAGLARMYAHTPYKIEPWLRSPYKEVHICNGKLTREEALNDRYARPTSWGYQDIPVRLLLAYDFIGKSGELEAYCKEKGIDLEKEIIDGFFMDTVRGSLLKTEIYGNMSPYVWQGTLLAGRIFGYPELVHIALLRMKEFLARYFYFDGCWYEVTSGYHNQCVYSMTILDRISKGYSDPEGYTCPLDGEHYENLAIFESQPVLRRAIRLVSDYLLYPDMIMVPHNDTGFNLKWRWFHPGEITPSNFISSWRHVAMKGPVSPNQTQLRITCAPVTTHRHQDIFNITLWALGKELLADIGYTHTKYRPYASSLPHHNTVTVNYKLHNWWSGSTHRPDKTNRMGTGAMPCMTDIDSLNLQVTRFRGFKLIPEIAEQTRTLMMARLDETNFYVVDFFDLASGGKCYDYFLHGSCDDDNQTPLEPGFEPAPILPAAMMAKLPKPKAENDKNYRMPGYGYQGFRNTQRLSSTPNVFVGHWAYPGAELDLFLAASGGKRSVFAGESPSIRRAGENNSKLDNAYRRFYMMRVENPTGPVRFAAVMQPHAPGSSQIKRVSVPQPGVVKVELIERTDYFFNSLPKSVNVDGIEFKGEYGFISLDTKGNVRDWYLACATAKKEDWHQTSPDALTLSIEAPAGPEAFKVTGLEKLPAITNRTVVLELPGEKSAWLFGIKRIDSEKGVLELDRPHGLEKSADGTWERTGYQRHAFKGPALLKVTVPSRKTTP